VTYCEISRLSRASPLGICWEPCSLSFTPSK